MSNLRLKYGSEALLLAMVVACCSAQPVAGQDRPDSVLENRGDAAAGQQSINVEGLGPVVCPLGGTGVNFLGIDNCPIGDATLSLNGPESLTVTLPDTTVPPPAVGECTVPPEGCEIDTIDDESAGNEGFIVSAQQIVIPDDMTAYFVELDGYWGLSLNNWDTASPSQTGFRHDAGTTHACADFNVSPVNCSTVVVEYRGGGPPGSFECPNGNLFSISGQSITLRSIIARGTCRGGGVGCSECDARDRAKVEFVFAENVSGWAVNGACTLIDGGVNFDARIISIKPKLSSCDDGETCGELRSGAGPSVINQPTNGVHAAGGNTPPLRKISLLAEAAALNTDSSAAAVAGSFTVLNEAVCELIETGSACKDGKDNDCDGLIDFQDPDCERVVPTVSAWAACNMALILCISAMILERRYSTRTASPDDCSLHGAKM